MDIKGPSIGANAGLKLSTTAISAKASAGATIVSVPASFGTNEAKLSGSLDVGIKVSGELSLDKKFKAKLQFVVFVGGSVNIELDPEAIAIKYYKSIGLDPYLAAILMNRSTKDILLGRFNIRGLNSPIIEYDKSFIKQLQQSRKNSSR